MSSRKRDRQSETPPPRASGIQVQHAADTIELGDMGMAGDDDIDAERDGINPQGFEIVHDEHRSVGESHEFGICIVAGPVACIHVPSDRGDRRDPAKRRDVAEDDRALAAADQAVAKKSPPPAGPTAPPTTPAGRSCRMPFQRRPGPWPRRAADASL